jgi:dTDP-4-dehydrorhamnose 3,5-epimerase
MIFTETDLPGSYVIDLEPLTDDRGFFARTFCADTFAGRGLEAHVSQTSVSFNRRRGTLRGLHFQAPPHAETKIVRCTAGAIFDVIVDIRTRSASFGRWFGVELNAANRRSLYIPDGFAHGFQTLVDDVEVQYQMSVPYHPASARGIRWNDARLNIGWPHHEAAITSPADRAWPDFAAAMAGLA